MVSREPLGPPEPVGDLPALQQEAAIELWLVESIWPWWHEVIPPREDALGSVGECAHHWWGASKQKRPRLRAGAVVGVQLWDERGDGRVEHAPLLEVTVERNLVVEVAPRVVATLDRVVHAALVERPDELLLHRVQRRRH